MKIIIKQNIGCFIPIEGLLFHSEGLTILVYTDFRINFTCFVIISLENYLINFVIPSITF